MLGPMSEQPPHKPRHALDDEPREQRSETGPSAEPDERSGARAAGRKKRSKLRTLLYVLLAMLLVVILAVGGFLLYLKYILDKDISRQDLLPSSTVKRDGAAGDAQNILLLGSDSRDTNLRDGSRSDVIQLVHISNDRQKVEVVHFPRDMYVDIPGHGKNKINAAYAYGGPTLLVQTIEKATNVRIDHVAQIGFSGFEKLTDHMGGVDMYVQQPVDLGNAGKWDQGMNHFTGLQARRYVQERKQLAQGDIDRGKNQQAWIFAIFQKAKSRGVLSNPMTITNITKDISNNLAVDKDFTTNYMTSLAYSLRGLKQENITFYTAPITGFGNEPGAGSVDYVDEPALKKLSDGLRKDDMTGVPNGRKGG